jgi:hypothetical protein
VSYRPVCDVWILARTKLKPDEEGNKQSYYGAYPAGFLHRARQLLGVRRTDPVLHVCGGMVKQCLYRGFEENDRTLDLCPDTNPDYLMDARMLGIRKGDLFPYVSAAGAPGIQTVDDGGPNHPLWPAILIDRPYTTADHAEYDVPREVFPHDLNDLLKRALECVEPGGRVGVLDYLWPSPPGKLGKEVAVIAVGTGRNNRARWFTVFERLVAKKDIVSSEEGQAKGNSDNSPTPVQDPEPVPPPAPSPEPVASAEPAEPAPTTTCVACGGTRQNSRGAPCVCVRYLSETERGQVLEAVKRYVCHGCQESLMLDAPGMETVEPLTDKPNKWHKACWEQAQRWAAEKRAKADKERTAREAQEKGWPICTGCSKPIEPTQKNANGRHSACGKPSPSRRRRRRTTGSSNNIGKGF